MRHINVQGLPNSRGTYELIKSLEQVDELRQYHEGHVLNSIDDAIPAEGASIAQVSDRISIWLTRHFGSIERLHGKLLRSGMRRFEVVVFKRYDEKDAPAFIAIFDVSSLFWGGAVLRRFSDGARMRP